MKNKTHLTDRGFIVGEFDDIYGAKCSIQESSLADKPALWLGVDKPRIKLLSADAKKKLSLPIVVPDEGSGEDYGWSDYILPEKVFAATRMHIDIDTARELIKLLTCFVENGGLSQREEKQQ